MFENQVESMVRYVQEEVLLFLFWSGTFSGGRMEWNADRGGLRNSGLCGLRYHAE